MEWTALGAKRPVSLIHRGRLTESKRPGQSLRSRGSVLDQCMSFFSWTHAVHERNLPTDQTENLETKFLSLHRVHQASTRSRTFFPNFNNNHINTKVFQHTSIIHKQSIKKQANILISKETSFINKTLIT